MTFTARVIVDKPTVEPVMGAGVAKTTDPLNAMVTVAGAPREAVKPRLPFFTAEWVGINLAQLDRRKLMIIYTDDIIRLHAVL